MQPANEVNNCRDYCWFYLPWGWGQEGWRQQMMAAFTCVTAPDGAATCPPAAFALLMAQAWDDPSFWEQATDYSQF